MTEQKRKNGKPLNQGIDKRSNGKQQAVKNKKTSGYAIEADNRWYFLIPLMFVAAIVPLIVYLKVMPLQGEVLRVWNGQQNNADFFSYYKGIWLEVATVSSLVLLFVKVMLDGPGFLRWTYFYVPAAIFAVLAALSAVRSQYPQIALNGFPDRYEGLWVLLTYLVLMMVTVALIQKERQLSLVLGAVFAGAIVIGVIGAFQYIGWDIWKSAWGRGLMLPAQYLQDADQIKFQFAAHTIYATLFHPDYVGSYSALLFPLIFALFILEERRKRKIALGLFTALMAFTWLGCNSRAGLFGGALGLLLILIMLRRYILRYWKYFAMGLTLLVILVFGLDRLSHGYLGQRIDSLLADAASLTKGQTATAENLPLKDIQIAGANAKVVTQDGTLNMNLHSDKIFFADAAGKPLPIKGDPSRGDLTILDSHYDRFQIKMGLLNQQHVVFLQNGQIKLFLGVDQDRFTFLDYKGDEIPLKRPPVWGFQGMERLGSSRGYIWSRSLPLLQHTVLLGYGPDTFAAYFPQYDIYGKMHAYYGDMWQLVDKPHDYYLQTAINTGVLSLLALLVLFGMYLIDSFRLYTRRNFDSNATRIGVGIMAGVTSYLGAAFFNDSVVSVAPVFWVLLGLGISANKLVRKSESFLS